MECTVPVQYIGPGHSAPRDQCRGNTPPYYRSSSFGNSFHCKKLFKARVFTQISISKRSFLLRSILMLFPSCIEESGSKCGDRFVCCQSFSRRVEEQQKEAHTKLEEKHPQFWRILDQSAGFAEEFPFGCRQDRLRCLIDGIGKFVSSAKDVIVMNPVVVQKKKWNMSGGSWQLVDLQLSGNFLWIFFLTRPPID